MRQRGFIIMDAIFGLIIVGALAGTLVLAMSRQSRAEQRLAESRTATRMAETAMAQLQSGQVVQMADAGAQIAAAKLSEASAAGWMWVRVDVTYGAAKASLTGLVPAEARLSGGNP